MKDTNHYQALMDAISESKPDLPRVRRAAKAMGLKAQGDLMEIMAEVLGFLAQNPPQRKKATEADL